MNVTAIAQNIYDELRDDSYSVAFIASWVRRKVGLLNLLLSTDYVLDDTTLEIVPEPDYYTFVILKTAFYIYYYERKANSFSGVNKYDMVVEVRADGTSTRFASPNDMAKSMLALRDERKAELQSLVNRYRVLHSLPSSYEGTSLSDTLFR